MKFKCGCEIDPTTLSMENVSLDCPAVYDLIASGNTKGLFQLESNLCKHWSKEIKPSSIDDISAIVALVRPGCLKAMSEGKSMTKHFADRKNGTEEVTYICEAIKPALESTYGILTYQEQAIEISRIIAGFSLQEADQLRKSIGKKLSEEMAKVKSLFLKKSKENGIVSPEIAEEIFKNIEKSQRYSFNKCIAADTVIRRSNVMRAKYQGKAGFTVDEMYRIRYDLRYAQATGHEQLRKRWKRLGYFDKSLSLCEDGRIRPNLILGISPAGKRQLFRVTLENGLSVKVTANHKFPTTRGEKTTAELRLSDSLFCVGEYDNHQEKGYPSIPVKIVKIEDVGFGETYDVTMAAPNHTFAVDEGIMTCNSHSVAYATLGYWTAYMKAHFPLQFYCSWLAMAKDKQDPQQEKRELINDAKTNGIDIKGPDFRRLKPHFFIDGNSVRFGLCDIKGLGTAQYEKLSHVEEFEVRPKIGLADKWSWYDFLTEMSRKVSSTAVNALIKAGALSYLDVPRTRMLYEYEKWSQLTEKEQDWVIAQRPRFNTLLDALVEAKRPKKEGGGAANKNRTAKLEDIIKSLENPPFSLDDRPDRVAFDEEKLLGVAISFSQVDACDTREANTTCRQFLDGINRDYMVMAVSIDKVREIKTKTGKDPGQKMAFLSISDGSCPLEDCVIFPDAYKEFGSEVTEGNTVLAQVERDKKRGSLIVKKVWSI